MGNDTEGKSTTERTNTYGNPTGQKDRKLKNESEEEQRIDEVV
jgi:hypothetical protein